MNISEVWGKPQLRRLMSGAELLLAYETDKYMKYYAGVGVELGDVAILKKLQKSEHYAFVRKQGYIKGGVDDIADDGLILYNPKFYFEDRIKDIDIAVTDDRYVFNWQSDTQKNLIMHGMNRSAAYISLFALVLVQNYIRKEHKALVIQQGSYAEADKEYDDILILKEYGNKLFSDSDLKIESSLGKIKETECSAYFTYQQQLGFMRNKVSDTVKYKYAMRTVKEGDVLLYYKRNRGEIPEHCFPAVVEKVSEYGLSFIYYPIVETLLTRKMKLLRLKKDEEDIAYSLEDYMNYQGCRVTESWDNIGFCETTYDEDVFVLQPFRDDKTVQYFRVSETQVACVECDTLETIYAVFEDRGIKYNKKGFLEKYFKGIEPKFDIVRKLGYSQKY